jgi:hypothetical protein
VALSHHVLQFNKQCELADFQPPSNGIAFVVAALTKAFKHALPPDQVMAPWTRSILELGTFPFLYLKSTPMQADQYQVTLLPWFTFPFPSATKSTLAYHCSRHLDSLVGIGTVFSNSTERARVCRSIVQLEHENQKSRESSEISRTVPSPEFGLTFPKLEFVIGKLISMTNLDASTMTLTGVHLVNLGYFQVLENLLQSQSSRHLFQMITLLSLSESEWYRHPESCSRMTVETFPLAFDRWHGLREAPMSESLLQSWIPKLKSVTQEFIVQVAQENATAQALATQWLSQVHVELGGPSAMYNLSAFSETYLLRTFSAEGRYEHQVRHRTAQFKNFANPSKPNPSVNQFTHWIYPDSKLSWEWTTLHVPWDWIPIDGDALKWPIPLGFQIVQSMLAQLARIISTRSVNFPKRVSSEWFPCWTPHGSKPSSATVGIMYQETLILMESLSQEITNCLQIRPFFVQLAQPFCSLPMGVRLEVDRFLSHNALFANEFHCPLTNAPRETCLVVQ